MGNYGHKRGGILGEKRSIIDTSLHVCECIRTPQQFTITQLYPALKSLPTIKKTQSDVSTPVTRLTISPTDNYRVVAEVVATHSPTGP